jgi:hypothetical protein
MLDCFAASTVFVFSEGEPASHAYPGPISQRDSAVIIFESILALTAELPAFTPSRSSKATIDLESA